ncbi:MarR family winged helix-turn-helix transcriptional regulator [Pseudomonas sp. PB3P13]
MVRLHKPFLEPLGLTFPQYLVVLELLNAAPQPVGVLGERLSMDTGTITPLLKRLELGGFVTRARDPRDERRVLVDLTSHGRALETEVQAVTGQIRSACQLDEKGVENLRHILDGLAHLSQEQPIVSTEIT